MVDGRLRQCAEQRASDLIDLKGAWRVSPDDRPEYAAADFDDGAWTVLELPRGELYFHGTKYWLRWRVELPENTDRSPLALTLGALQDVYEIYVNGVRCAISSSWPSAVISNERSGRWAQKFENSRSVT